MSGEQKEKILSPMRQQTSTQTHKKVIEENGHLPE